MHKCILSDVQNGMFMRISSNLQLLTATFPQQMKRGRVKNAAVYWIGLACPCLCSFQFKESCCLTGPKWLVGVSSQSRMIQTACTSLSARHTVFLCMGCMALD